MDGVMGSPLDVAMVLSLGAMNACHEIACRRKLQVCSRYLVAAINDGHVKIRKRLYPRGCKMTFSKWEMLQRSVQGLRYTLMYICYRLQ